MSLFITFEGPDGSGKTTITRHVAQKLEEKGVDVELTREPGGIEISEKIREIILDVNNTTMDDRTEALLYAAGRRQHLVERVLPALEAGKVVVCDRFVDSSIAYQGYGRGIGAEAVYSINHFAIESHMPDVTFFLDIDPIKGMERVGKRAPEDRLELAGDAFHQKVYEGYKKIIERDTGRIVVINAEQSIDVITLEILEILSERFGL